MQIKDLENGEYTSSGKFYFDSNVKNIEINAEDALKIAYTLFDWVGLDYEILDKISEKLEG